MSRAASVTHRSLAGLALVLAAGLYAAEAELDPAVEYLQTCARCHGVEGEGTTWAPPIFDEGAAGAFFWTASGRMPIDRPDQPVTRSEPVLSPDQIAAIAEYVAALGEGPELPEVEPGRGEVSDGARIYLLECAACHGATGIGGAMVEARNAPNITGLDPVIVAAAIRSGPAGMPLFDEDTLSPEELNSVVAYLDVLTDPPTPGGWDLGGWGAVAEGAVAWMLGIVIAVGAAIWIKAGARSGEDNNENGEEMG